MVLKTIIKTKGKVSELQDGLQITSENCSFSVKVGNGPVPDAMEVPPIEQVDTEGLRIRISIVFNKDVDGNELLFGNDFDEPIRDILPYGFSFALGLFKKLVDPSVDGDAYADQPYLYGRALTSFTTIYYKEKGKDWVTIDKPSANSRRHKYLQEKERQQFQFSADTLYYLEFATPYLEINDQTQAVCLPGFKYDVTKLTCSQPLRYTLKDNSDVFLSIEFHRSDDDPKTDLADDSKGSQTTSSEGTESEKTEP